MINTFLKNKSKLPKNRKKEQRNTRTTNGKPKSNHINNFINCL